MMTDCGEDGVGVECGVGVAMLKHGYRMGLLQWSSLVWDVGDGGGKHIASSHSSSGSG
jgi:hypothetical protein